MAGSAPAQPTFMASQASSYSIEMERMVYAHAFAVVGEAFFSDFSPTAQPGTKWPCNYINAP